MTFHRPTFRLALAFAALVSLVLAAALASPHPASAGDGARLTLEASKKQLRPGQKTDLSGTLSGVFSGNDGKTVTLWATPYPYDEGSPVGTTTTDADGDYSFPNLNPKLNTRYQASFDGDLIDGDANSNTVQIFRFIRGDLDLKVTDDGFAEARFDFFYSDQVKPEYYAGREDLHWYFGKTTADRFRRVAKVRFRNTARGVGGGIRYRLPRSRNGYNFFLFPCIEAPAADIGIGNKKPIQCPRSFKNTRNRAASVRAYAE